MSAVAIVRRNEATAINATLLQVVMGVRGETCGAELFYEREEEANERESGKREERRAKSEALRV